MTEKKRIRFSDIPKRKLPVEPDPEVQSESETQQAPAAAAPAAPVPRPAPAKSRQPGKKDNPNYVQVTVYLRKDIYKTTRKLLIDDGRQVSELVDDLVSGWIDRQKSGQSAV
jgi:hypothetical protein